MSASIDTPATTTTLALPLTLPSGAEIKFRRDGRNILRRRRGA